MIVYCSTFFGTLFLLYLINIGKKKGAKTIYLYITIALLLIIIAGFRYKVGSDYVRYTNNYYQYLNNGFYKFSQWGLAFVAKVSSLIYNNSSTWIFLMSALTIGLSMIAIYKYSPSISLSVVFYILLGCWHTSFNIIKQMAAAAILFAGYKYIREKNLIKWILVCILASTFHISSLFFILVWFVAVRKPSYKTPILLFLFAALFSVFNFVFVDFFSFIRETDISNEVAKYSSINILRALVYISPTIFWFINRNKYDYEDPDFCCLLNFLWIHTAIVVATMSNIYFTRFTEYTLIYLVLFFPYLLKPFLVKGKKYVIVIIITLYFIFWFYDLYKGSTTANYRWIFNNF